MSPFLVAVSQAFVLPKLLLVFQAFFVFPEHQIIVYFLTKWCHYVLSCYQFHTILDAILVWHHKISQFLGNFIQFLAFIVHLFQHLSVVGHVVIYGVVDVWDLADVVFFLFLVVEVFLQFVPSSVDEHERLALWFQFVLKFDVLGADVVTLCGTGLFCQCFSELDDPIVQLCQSFLYFLQFWDGISNLIDDFSHVLGNLVQVNQVLQGLGQRGIGIQSLAQQLFFHFLHMFQLVLSLRRQTIKQFLINIVVTLSFHVSVDHGDDDGCQITLQVQESFKECCCSLQTSSFFR